VGHKRRFRDVRDESVYLRVESKIAQGTEADRRSLRRHELGQSQFAVAPGGRLSLPRIARAGAPTAAVAKSDPDGYVLLLHTIATHGAHEASLTR
jgi:hypothetical protein